MSILQTHLWGKRREQVRLATPVGLRMARMGNHRALTTIALTVAGYWSGSLAFFGALIVVAGSSFVGKLPTSTLFEGTREFVISKGWKLALLAAVLSSLLFILPAAGRWYFDRSAASFPARDRAAERRGRRRAAWIVGAMALAATGGLAAQVLSGRWEVACLLAGNVAGGAGVSAVLIGLFTRQGSRVVCRKCGYPMGSWKRAADRCPECGNAWKEPWRAALGTRGVQWPMVGWGIACLGIAAALAVAIGWSVTRH